MIKAKSLERALDTEELGVQFPSPPGNILYIDCAGVNVPCHWDIDQLKSALAMRWKKFKNEGAIIADFERFYKESALLQEVR